MFQLLTKTLSNGSAGVASPTGGHSTGREYSKGLFVKTTSTDVSGGVDLNEHTPSEIHSPLNGDRDRKKLTFTDTDLEAAVVATSAQSTTRPRQRTNSHFSIAGQKSAVSYLSSGDASQRSMEPVVAPHIPITAALPSGALSVVAFAFFVLLIALEFVGIFPLSSIFTLIAICLVGSVLLINYYRGNT